MIKIRLSRTGKRNKPFYRIVATDERQKSEGKPLEVLGFWQPSTGMVEIKQKEIDAWVKKGAKITPAVEEVLGKNKK